MTNTIPVKSLKVIRTASGLDWIVLATMEDYSFSYFDPHSGKIVSRLDYGSEDEYQRQLTPRQVEVCTMLVAEMERVEESMCAEITDDDLYETQYEASYRSNGP